MIGLRLLYREDDTIEEQGQWGEFQINRLFTRPSFKAQECYLFKDIYLEVDDKVFQIDHIFVCLTGVFVIETKMISGRVKGSVRFNKWTGYIGKRRTEFYNPIWQNINHVKALQVYLGDDISLNSIVVFPNNNKPKDMPPYVLNKRELEPYILNFVPDKPITHEDMMYIKDKLEALVPMKKELMLKHRKQIKNYK